MHYKSSLQKLQHINTPPTRFIHNTKHTRETAVWVENSFVFSQMAAPHGTHYSLAVYSCAKKTAVRSVSFDGNACGEINKKEA